MADSQSRILGKTTEDKALHRLYQSTETRDNILFPRGTYTCFARELLCSSGIAEDKTKAQAIIKKLERLGFVTSHNAKVGLKKTISVKWTEAGFDRVQLLIEEDRGVRKDRREAGVDKSKILHDLSRGEQMKRRDKANGIIFVDLDNIAIPLIRAGAEFSEITRKILDGLSSIAAEDAVTSPFFHFVTCDGFLKHNPEFGSWLSSLSPSSKFHYEVVYTGKDIADDVIAERVRERLEDPDIECIFIASGDGYFNDIVTEAIKYGKRVVLVPFSPSSKNNCFRDLELERSKFHVRYLEKFLDKEP